MISNNDPLAMLNVSRETIASLEQLVLMMKKWNPAINLVSRSTVADAWHRHILDSAQILALAPDAARQWADLGSGGGFPGLVIAILAKELRPLMKVTLVEADQRKATFLRQASQSFSLAADVLPMRIEATAPLAADVVSARALAPLPALCGFALRHLGSTGVALFMKGAAHDAEIAEARKVWVMDMEVHPSVTDPKAVILKVKGLSHV